MGNGFVNININIDVNISVFVSSGQNAIFVFSRVEERHTASSYRVTVVLK
jgi:hypothetical protein